MFHDRDFVSEEGSLEWRPFHHTLEDVYGAVAQYYDLASLSFRRGRARALWERRARAAVAAGPGRHTSAS